MSPSSLLLLLLASCALAMPADNIEGSGAAPEAATEDAAPADAAVVVEAVDASMATGDAAFATNFGTGEDGATSVSFSATASGSATGQAISSTSANSGEVLSNGGAISVQSPSAEASQISGDTVTTFSTLQL